MQNTKVLTRNMRPQNAKKEQIRIGFGPITNSNSFYQSGRKVAKVLAEDGRFILGFFSWEPFDADELREFDVVVFIKYLPDVSILKRLKKGGVRMYLDYHDTFLCPSVYEEKKWLRAAKFFLYLRTEFSMRMAMSLLNGCFYASPLLKPVIMRSGMKPLYLPRQIYNQENRKMYKQHSRKTTGLVIYWTGVGLNQAQNTPLLPTLKKLCDKYQCRLVYDTDEDKGIDWIEYRKFDRKAWPKKMLDADIAFRWRDHSNMQKYKDPNKVLSYMAAGLPTVIFPSVSEKSIMEDGKTGFFATSIEEFEAILEMLIITPTLRSPLCQNSCRLFLNSCV